MDILALLSGLRFVDSFFPSGGFAFSSGLEAAVHGGTVRNGEDLRRYAEDWLCHGIGPCEGVAVGEGHRALEMKDIALARRADATLEAMKLAHESRQASRQMGRQVVRISGEQFGDPAVLREFREAIETGRTPGHAAVAVGMALAACGWPREQAVAAYLYQTTVGLVSAGMKLLPVGQAEGQRLLAGLAPVIMQGARDARDETEMKCWTPVQDIYAMRHARLASRMFRS